MLGENSPPPTQIRNIKKGKRRKNFGTSMVLLEVYETLR